MNAEQKHILVVKPSSLGDVLHGLQVIESLRVQQPQIHVSWVVVDALAPLLEACQTVDEVFIFKRKGGLCAFVRLLRKIRRSRHYDAVLDLQGLARSGLMTLCARADRKIGRSDAREGARFCYGETVPLPAAQVSHAVTILSGFLPLLGASASVQGCLVFNFEKSRLDRTDDLEQAVLVFPESRREEKNWPYFTDFVEEVALDFPTTQFIWCGSERLADQCPHGSNIVNLAGRTNLLDMVALVQRALCVVANDSGPVHLAAAMSIPVLGLYGPTDPNKYGPFPLSRKSNRVLRAPDGLLSQLTVPTVVCEFADMMARYAELD